jgi:hypothetical protein
MQVVTGQQGAAAGRLEALAAAVFGSASGRDVAAAIEAAAAAGASVPAGDTLFLPAVALPARAVPVSWRGWVASGYLPLRIRYCAHPPPQLRTLAGVLAALDGLPELNCVPQHLSGHWLVSLHLPEAYDLRELASGGYADARRVHAHCLSSLGRFAAADAALREAISDGGLPPPYPFPVPGRYRWAVDRLRGLLGAVDLPATLPEPAFDGPSLLFCDPKPANFLVPPAGGQDFPRIDLELMCYETPLALQIVLALFAHPVSFHRPGRPDEQFADLRDYAHEAAAHFGVALSHLDVLLAYHLVRNFVSAAGSPGRGAEAKALSFAALLACATEQLPCLRPADRTGRLLRRWIGRHGLSSS